MAGDAAPASRAAFRATLVVTAFAASAAVAAASACFVSIGPLAAAADGGRDAVTDGTSGTGDANVAPCDGGAFLCDDFERVDLVGPWDSFFDTADGGVTLTHDLAHSGTTSLLAVMSQENGSAAGVKKAFPASHAVHLSLWIWVDTALRDRALNAVVLAFDYGARSVEIMLVLNGTTSKATIAEQERGTGSGPSYDALASTGLIRGRWLNATIDLDQSTTPQTVSASFAANTYASALPLQYSTPIADGHLTIGSSFASGGTPMNIAVDDVDLVLSP